MLSCHLLLSNHCSFLHILFRLFFGANETVELKKNKEIEMKLERVTCNIKQTLLTLFGFVFMFIARYYFNDILKIAALSLIPEMLLPILNAENFRKILMMSVSEKEEVNSQETRREKSLVSLFFRELTLFQAGA